MTGQDANPPAIIRRREKRRHVAPNSVDLRDPLNLINLAVRIDEVSSIYNGTSLVSVPLESGRLYNQDEFQTALKYLKKTTSARQSAKQQLLSDRLRSPLVWLLAYFLDWLHPVPQQNYPNVAITPIILSGLLAAQSAREKEETDAGQKRDEKAMPTTTELLIRCISMRRAALERLEWRKKRQKLQNIIVITLALLVLISIYRQNMLILRDNMLELGYLGSYQGNKTGDLLLPGEISTLPKASCIHPCASMALTKKELVQLELELADDLASVREGAILKSIEDIKLLRFGDDIKTLPNAAKVSQHSRSEVGDTTTNTEAKKHENNSNCGYEGACLAAETQLWSHLGSYAVIKNRPARICDGNGCVPDFKFHIKKFLSKIDRQEDLQLGHAPYAIHTPIMRNKLVAPGDQMYVLQSAPQQSSNECNVVNDDIRWLGSSSVNVLVTTILKRRFSQLGISDRPKILDIGCGVGGTLYALAHPMGLLEKNAPETCWTQNNIQTKHVFYEGISISGAEIAHAQNLAIDHGMNPSKFRFSQLSFDDPSLRSMGYSAAFAIESLSFSQNITKTLQGLADAVNPDGTFIVIDDTVTDPSHSPIDIDAQKQSSLLEMYSQFSKRETLMTQNQWINELQGGKFRVDRIIDLGLRFDFPLLIDARLGISALMRMWLTKQIWQSDRFLSLLEAWEWWLRRPKMSILSKIFGKINAKSPSYANIRTSQMFQGFAYLNRAQTLRKEAYKEGFLTYKMFICTKIK